MKSAFFYLIPLSLFVISCSNEGPDNFIDYRNFSDDNSIDYRQILKGQIKKDKIKEDSIDIKKEQQFLKNYQIMD